MNSFQLAIAFADRAQNNFNKRLAQQSGSQSQQTGLYKGYDADTGIHFVELASGQTVNCRSISNAGLAINQPVACSFPQGAIIGYIREMCR
jgi:hypothetical protein